MPNMLKCTFTDAVYLVDLSKTLLPLSSNTKNHTENKGSRNRTLRKYKRLPKKLEENNMSSDYIDEVQL